MKIRANKKGYRYIGTLFASLAVFLAYSLKTGQPGFIVAMDTTALVLLAAFSVTFGRSMLAKVTVDERGVSARFLFWTLGSLLWEEMAEVGVGTEGFGRRRQYYVYFVRYALNEMERHMIPRMVQNDSAVWMELSKRAMEAVSKYYTGHIHALEVTV